MKTPACRHLWAIVGAGVLAGIIGGYVAKQPESMECLELRSELKPRPAIYGFATEYDRRRTDYDQTDIPRLRYLDRRYRKLRSSGHCF